jgi:Peptidase family M1 domain
MRFLEKYVRKIFCICLLMLSCLPPQWLVAETNIPQYEQLRQYRFSTQAIAIPANGITFERENATWFLKSGTVRLMEPTADGKVTGLVFEGKGRFKMTIPHWVERQQLQRCSRRQDYNHVDEAFDKLLIRTPEPFLKDLFTLPTGTQYKPNNLVSGRHKMWLKLGKEDVDARVTAGLFNPGDEYLRVEMKTSGFGWLTYVFDKYLIEEIQLRKYRRKYEFMEIWVSLDRQSQRLDSGAPSATQVSLIDITHQEIDANLTNIKLSFGVWKMANAGFKTTVSFRALQDNVRMVQLMLHPNSHIIAVRSAGGDVLPFIRRRVKNNLLTKLDNHYPFSFWVLLDKPCVKGAVTDIIVIYEMGIRDFVSGASWYPTLMDNMTNFNDQQTVRLTARMKPGLEIRAVGKRIRESRRGRDKISVWQSDGEVDIYGFTLAKEFREARVKIEGLPEVVSFCNEHVRTSASMVRNVAVDITNAMQFYKSFFDVQFPDKPVWATAIESGHGQTFDSFLHFSLYTFLSEHPGASELFRAHETAHLLWGHMVGWKTYRDQWLSEAFSEYSAMLFIQAVMPKKKHFSNILEAYKSELLGSIKVMFSKYVRPWKMMMSKRNRDKLGPIGVGFRAAVADVPMGYQIQIYHKGPLVLHMIRMMMYNATGNNTLFRNVLKDFLHTYKGKLASTGDFKGIIEKWTKQDWSWFFNQWVYGTAIPTYSWNYSAKKDKSNGKYNVLVTVKQKNVPPGFKMPVPMRVLFKDGKSRLFVLPINKSEQSFNMTFPKKIKKMLFNENHSVLAKVKKY